MTDFEKIYDFKNLYVAYRKSKSGGGHERSSARFSSMAMEGVSMLSELLESKTYEVGRYSTFEVTDPKRRIIMSGEFKDNVVQHSLCDNVLIPAMKNEFIGRNFAGQSGKGTLFGLDCLKKDMLAFYGQHGHDGHFLKCDLTKFFYSIEHDALKNIVRFHITDPDVVWLCDKFIDSTKGPGLPLGNQTSQVFALMLLNGLDHFITGELGTRYYGRYTDDFYLIHRDKSYLKWCLGAITEFVGGLGLSLNEKTQIIPFKSGIDFLGFHTYITDDGKIIRKLRNSNKRTAQSKYRKMAKLVRCGKLSKKKFYDSYNSWKNHALHGNCKKLVWNMDKMINDVMEGK